MVLSNFTNQSAIARLAAGIFFPQRPALGLDQRSYSPAVLDKIVSANAEHKSAYKAQKMLWKLGEVSISVSEIMDLSGMIGQELCEHLQQQSLAHAEQRLEPQHPQPPRVAVVSVDGGRIMTREEGERGVHEQRWKETKNACLLTMSSTPSDTDPHPELPACFTNREYVEKLVREMHSSGYCGGKSEEIPAISPKTAAPSSTTVEPSNSSANSRRQEKPWRPKRLMRTCISSMACSDDFGPVVAGEAQQRGFYQAEQKGFVGDGGTWNWTIHAAYFSDFVPITDFVHPLGYLYDVAQVLSPQDPGRSIFVRQRLVGKGAWQRSWVSFVHGRLRISRLRTKSCRRTTHDRLYERRSPIWRITKDGWTTRATAAAACRYHRS